MSFGRTLAIRAARLSILVALAFPACLFGAWRLFDYWFAPPRGNVHVEANDDSWSYAVAQHLAPVETFDSMPDSTLVRDDACRECERRELAHIELRVASDDVGYIGHAFIHTPNRTLGFLTDDMDIGLIDWLNPLSSTVPGHTRDDRYHRYDFVTRYRACPESVALLEASMLLHGRDPYQVGDWNGGRNCATWARDRLMEAGFDAPEGNCPNRMARAMTPVRLIRTMPAFASAGREDDTACR